MAEPIAPAPPVAACAPIADRAATLRASAIREIFDAAQRVPGALRLEVGEPDFASPPWVVEAADRAARDGATHYTPNTGIAPLRDALADKVRRVNGWEATAAQCIVTAGGVQALHLALAAVLDPGDEVLLPDPLWPNFAMITHLISARAVSYRLVPEAGFLPSIEELESLVTARTRVLVINFPSNPTGAAATEAQLAELVGFARRRGLWLVSDECYDELVFDTTVRSAQAAAPYERTVSVYTFSKTYAMTGWRVGYAFAPLELLTVMARMQEPMVSCVNAPAQHAALAALTGPQDVVVQMRDAYRRRAAAAVGVLRAGGLAVPEPQGAFYLWVDTSGDPRDSITLAHDLLRDREVAVAPGLAFGASGRHRLRISLASADADLLEGCRRLAAYLRG
ncbi:MAG: aminotransferase class I/II-fold pyridoxal phosphate-dependent enzyme [Acidimicrobiales bacterium]